MAVSFKIYGDFESVLTLISVGEGGRKEFYRPPPAPFLVGFLLITQKR